MSVPASQEGHLSVDDAVRHAQGMGVDMETEKSTTQGGLALAEGKIYNFSVYKINSMGGKNMIFQHFC